MSENRIIEIADCGAFLRIKNKLLEIYINKKLVASVPLADIAALVLANPGIVVTHSVLSSISENGGSIIVSNNKHKPVGMILPLTLNSIQSEIFREQAEVKLTVKKKVWQLIVREKIQNQGKLLYTLFGKEYGFKSIAAKVKTGDGGNAEAFAARKYWKFLGIFEKRNRFAEDENIYLNYGYSILYALTARAIASSGLHPGLGVSHKNKYNPFCLASDFMEPFRPIVDYIVYSYLLDNKLCELNSKTRKEILKLIDWRFKIKDEYFSLFYTLSRLSASYVKMIKNQGSHLTFPDLSFDS